MDYKEQENQGIEVPMDADAIEVFAEYAALKGMTPSQLLGLIAGKVVEVLDMDGYYSDGSGHPRERSLGKWLQDLKPRDNFISWITNYKGENLPVNYVDWYEDEKDGCMPDLEEWAGERPGRTVEEAENEIEKFSREYYSLWQNKEVKDNE